MTLITVKAAPGLRVPMEGAPRKYIGQDSMQVPPSAYYLRRLADGDLVQTGGKAAKGGK